MQLVTADSMPAVDVKVDNNAGVYEIRIAPNLPTRLYMAYRGFVYRSDNRGGNWIRTDFANVVMNPNDNYRPRGQKMAVDPANPDIVYTGTPQNGLFVTINGGTSWQSVSAVPVSQKNGDTYPGIGGIAFDPALGVTGGKTNTIFAASYGNGVYESTNAGASWSAIGGPTDITYAAVSSTGVYYVAAYGDSIWSYYNGAWTKLTTASAGIAAVAVNPSNPNEVVALNQGGSLDVSYNAAQTWSGVGAYTRLRSTDIPWLADSGLYMTIGGLAFDPLNPNELITSAGVGVWNTIVPTANYTWGTPVTWNDQSVGIEQLVANEILVPPGGDPVVASWDRPFFYVSNPEVYPSTYGPVNGSFAAGWSLDYASSDPSFIVGIADWWGTEESGYSTNGGRTWTPFATYPPLPGKIGGDIAASTPKNIIWAPSNNSSPFYTDDGGATWTPIKIDGVPTTGDTGWGGAYYLRRHIVAADRVTAKAFYMYNSSKGLYRSRDGGATWALVHHGEIAPWSGFNAELRSVPDYAGHLFFTSGPQGGAGDRHPAENPFMRSIDGGSLWSAVPNVLEVRAFGFGKSLTDYPTIFIVGWVNHIYGIWRSDDNAHSWIQIGNFPVGSLDSVTTIDGDKSVYGKVYLGFGGSGYAFGSLEK